ncbi:MAG: mRNA interferase MqsR [Burkholderiales bacterium PBB3]|nr:MAG: mRNA interferase MqsR [Burkholderiales bacterium PBB3]
MEKSSPHCSLRLVHALIHAKKVRTTQTARVGADALGFDFVGMMAVVLALKPTDFYKSMTTHADHTLWQDVYHPKTAVGNVYLKLMVVDDLLIVSFKEL